MRLARTALVAGAIAALSGTAYAGGTFNLFAELSGDNEVPASGSGATGTMTGVYDSDANTFSFSWEIFDLEGTPADPGSHIHNAPIGVNGPIVFGFNEPDGTWPLSGSAVWENISLDEGLDLVGGEMYLNFHTDQFPAGELRGQIIPAPGVLGAIGVAGLGVVRRRRR